MLGSVRGRVYYNLLSWYRVLALLPGFSVNRRFMEQMMGVTRADARRGAGRRAAGHRLGPRGATRCGWARSLVGLVCGTGRGCPRSIDRFYARLDAALGAPTPLAEMRLDELTAHYRDLERQLLTRWDAPLVNDFFAMIFYGVLRTLSKNWLGSAVAGLHNDLLVGEGGIVSAEPARRLQALGSLAAADARLTAALVAAPLPEILEAMAAPANQPFVAAYQAYLDKFGDRCLDELKLESPTLADDPTDAAAHGRPAGRARAGANARPERPSRRRGATDSRSHQAGGRSPGRRGAGPASAAAAALQLGARPRRARVRDRENLRFERTRVFGRVRRIFVEAGKRLAGEGLLTRADDVFYLEVDEVLGLVEGTVTTASLAALADVRRREFDAYRQMEAPADRFETRGAVWIGNRFQAAPVSAGSAAAAALGEDERRGIGCCPGVVAGAAQVIRDPRGASLAPGEILVAERTDPGWIMLFPAAAGVLVERGSLLSHSAIVARELGLPAVVSLPGLTTWLQTGDRVAVDGATGVVRRLSRAEGPSA